MRLHWLWLLTVPALVGSVMVPWGEKHIDDHACQTTWDPESLQGGERCSSDEWHVAYRPFSLQTTHTIHAVLGNEGTSTDWAYHYYDADAPHAEGIGPLLKLGGAALLIGGSLLALTGIIHQVVGSSTTLLGARIGWAIYAGTAMSFILGMAYHAGTWRAEEVDNLRPALGLLLGATPLLAGIPLLPERRPEMGLPVLPALD